MNTNNSDYLYRTEVFNIVGACMTVHNQLGRAFLEPVYQEALAIEMGKRGIPFSREHKMEIYYNDAPLNKKYYADFLCYDHIVVELKACDSLRPEHTAQALNYLSALKLRLALLVNFGTLRLQWKRVII